ncbi:multicopper oxidase-domain-containing protein [Absidia repens]|uniref:Multicopper oxidase-domain-containing protein n=1 Tax=Absidia repens TaxID=90262 RepID=A0A1X2IN33_9FUNG|nr:multicopper oxidase-domain-containing protein [Absidia repens]
MIYIQISLLLLLLISSILSPSFFTVVTAELRKFDLHISQSQLDPDCFGTSYPALLVNGQFPGPTLRAVRGDEVEVRVTNDADVPTSIHFHGIRQYGTVESDGVPDVTQNAINPGSTFIHRFQLIGQAGTYFYHAHVGVQDDTVQGAFISDGYTPEKNTGHLREHIYQDGPHGYDDEFILHLTEWWHQAYSEREDLYLGGGFTHDPSSDSLLFNGRTLHNASEPGQQHCEGHTVFDVLPDRTYRMRVIGGNTFRTFGLAIKGHNMTIIEVDGELVHPYTTDHLEVTPGQRFSVLLHTKPFDPRFLNGGNMFAIATAYRYRSRGSGYTENGYGFLRYVDTSQMLNKRDSLPSPLSGIQSTFPRIPNPITRDWIWQQLRPIQSIAGKNLDQPPDRTLKMRTWSVKLPDKSTRYLVNGKLSPMITNMFDLSLATSSSELDDQEDPMLDQFTLSKMESTDGYEPEIGTYPIRLNETVDIVLQNVKSGRNCLLHPWHTHGHSHYVLASGDGEYVHERDQSIRNFPHPIYKDVSAVYASEIDPQTKGCGWTKIRIHADNPGVWAVHCHITAHMLQGKMFLLEEASEWIDKFRRYK